MKNLNPLQRLKFLRKEITRYTHHYHVLDCSNISDADYDKLYFELVALEQQYPQFFDSSSPTQRIGAANTGFQKVKHGKKMLSLDNMKTAADVINYLGTEEVVVEPKIDGASLKLIYREGKLVQAITRGNGMEGDDVTANARAIMSIPLVLPDPVDLTVVGEVYMTFTVFNKLNERLAAAGEELMANPRNAAAGSLKLKSPKEVATRKLSFVAYDSTDEFTQFTQYLLIEHLAVLNFESVSMLPVTKDSLSVHDMFLIEDEAQLQRRIEEADICRKCLDLPTDGLVFKLNDREKQRELGEGNKYPKWACAFKFPPERKATVLKGVTIQVGRTGKVTPVAELEPVGLSGTTVRRASLCNQAEIKRLNVDIGDTVLVEKSAEIIPKVVGVAKKVGTKAYTLPAQCPCCATKLVCPEGYVDSYCPNAECSDQVFVTLLHGCGKTALDIDGCGKVLVGELMVNGVKKLSDIFLVDPAFMKPATRKRFEAGREAAKGQPFWRKLHALGIEGFGSTLCQEFAQKWTCLADAFHVDEAKGIDEVSVLVDLVGESVYDNMAYYIGKHADEIDALDGLIGMTGSQAQVGPLTGKSFCITGDLMAGSRNDVSRRIEDAGGVVKSSVSRHLNYLIQGTETGKTKRAAAEKHGIPVITEQQLFVMMEQEMPKPKDAEDREY
jgi:DNA ligase (NAD+)